MVLTDLDDEEGFLAGVADTAYFGACIFGEFGGGNVGISSDFFEHVRFNFVEVAEVVVG